MSEDLLVWLAGQAVIAAAVWGAIRADIKGIHRRIDSLNESNTHAHQRIDAIYSQHKN